MAFQGTFLEILLLVLAITFSSFGIGISNHVLSRSCFPDGFVFGTASSAYQYEGAAYDDGKGLSIWDNFTHQTPARIANNSNGDISIDFYNRYKEDIKLMKYIGLDAFRFSISWSRLLPNGKLSGGINKEGLAFYNNLINELLANGIQPFVTLFHWDLPQALADEYGGFLSPLIVEDFRDFAELCYKEFGDRVKHWITLNEPLIYAWLGYDIGMIAPGRCSSWRRFGCPAGDSATEPYIVGHHLLLSHASAFRIYKEKYQAIQKGQVGITLQSAWMVPSSDAQTDHEATYRALEFSLGWYMQPLTFGEYPTSMRKIVEKRLPEFSNDEAERVKGSFDFIGLNYYSSFSISDIPSTGSLNISYTIDSRARQTPLQDEKLKQKGVTIVTMYPEGLREILVYVQKTYGDPNIYITENGMADTTVSTVQEGVNDFMRVYFYKHHLLSLREAIETMISAINSTMYYTMEKLSDEIPPLLVKQLYFREEQTPKVNNLMSGVRVKGFFAWSFLDNFEWWFGYNSRYGMGYVDYNDGLKRHLKSSALWFKKLLLRQ